MTNAAVAAYRADGQEFGALWYDKPTLSDVRGVSSKRQRAARDARAEKYRGRRGASFFAAPRESI